ncbi:MAG: SBBP repeat-containing protein [Sphingobacteriaceae bacterium]|nr:SBBP repeat-containing protein [Sphingobacteriaceae bacterium]
MYSTTLDKSGNIYSIGIFQGTLDIDPGATTSNFISNGGYDIYIQKFNTAGNLVWAKQFGGVYNDYGTDIEIQSNGNVIITGNFEGVVDFDPSVSTYTLSSGVSNADIFLVSLTSAGNFNFAKSYGNNTGNELAQQLKIDGLNNIYFTGYTSSQTGDIDPGPSTFTVGNNTYEALVAKLDNGGNMQWAKSFGGSGNDYGASIALDSSNFVYTVGQFQGSVDLDPSANTYTALSNGGFDGFIQKLNSNGQFIWAKKYRGASGEVFNSVVCDKLNKIYVGGTFYNTVDFNPGLATNTLTSNGNTDIFVLKLDSNANYIWAYNYGGASYESNPLLSVDSLNNLYTIGNYNGTIDFDPSLSVSNLSSAGLFIQKLSSVGVFDWVAGLTTVASTSGTSINISSIGDIVFSGNFASAIDCDPSSGTAMLTTSTLTPLGESNLFICKWSPVTSTGLSEMPENDFNVNVFPNYFENALLRSNQNNCKLSITDIQGKEIYTNNIMKI